MTRVAEQYALPVATLTALTPVVPAALPVAVARTGLSAIFSADTLTHAGLTAMSLGGLGIFAYAGGLTTSIIAAAALATGAIGSRFLSGPNPQRQLVASLDAERHALNSSRSVIEHQVMALQGDRQNLDADRTQLAADRQDFAQRVSDEAGRIIAPQQQDLETARAALASERAAFDAGRGGITKALQEEGAQLTAEEVVAIHHAATVYTSSASGVYPRFAAEANPSTLSSNHGQQQIASDQCLITLVGTGQLVAGNLRQCSDGSWSIPTSGSTTITSIAQLRTYLRLATGCDV